MVRILFVCHGNICRSPMAEYVMKDLVKKAGLEGQFQIASAAGRRAAPRSIRRPGGSWRSTASPATATLPSSSAALIMGSTTCLSEWTRPTSAICTASAAAIPTASCTSCWSIPVARVRRWQIPGIPGTLRPRGGMCWLAAGGF